jgi:hypothetical protein
VEKNLTLAPAVGELAGRFVKVQPVAGDQCAAPRLFERHFGEPIF